MNNGNPIRKRLAQLVLLLIAIAALATIAFWYVCIRMPGESAVPSNNAVAYNEAPRAATEEEAPEEEATEQAVVPVALDAELQQHVVQLAETIGERNLGHYESLCEAANYVESNLRELGYPMERQTYQVNNLDCFNVVAEVTGGSQPDEIIIIGAHYDSVRGTPGANDNGSGVATMLSLAKLLADFKPDKTLRFVGFTNEEPPYFQNRGEMGSWVYAEACRKADDNIVAVLSLETMGYFSDEPDSQNYPPPLNAFYPSTGNFIGFVSNVGSSQLQRRVIKVFRENSSVPSEGASLPSSVPGVGWSDHWSFWQEGYPGIMITDTAPFRYPHYHEPTDTPDKIDFVKLAEVTESLVHVIKDLCSKND